jgi:hypothetical protein
MQSLNTREQMPGVLILWQYENRRPPYVIQVVQLRWPANTTKGCAGKIIRYSPGKPPFEITEFSKAYEPVKASKILKQLDNKCHSLLPNLDPRFWAVLVLTVKYRSWNLGCINQEIKRLQGINQDNRSSQACG